MNQLSRNLLYLHKENTPPQSLEKEILWLDKKLVHLENSDWFVAAHEIININKRKIYRDKKTILKTVERATLRHFEFINNNN